MSFPLAGEAGGIISEEAMLKDSSVVAEPRREITVAAECDVLVCGGGPAGFGAADTRQASS